MCALCTKQKFYIILYYLYILVVVCLCFALIIYIQDVVHLVFDGFPLSLQAKYGNTRKLNAYTAGTQIAMIWNGDEQRNVELCVGSREEKTGDREGKDARFCKHISNK